MAEIPGHGYLKCVLANDEGRGAPSLLLACWQCQQVSLDGICNAKQQCTGDCCMF